MKNRARRLAALAALCDTFLPSLPGPEGQSSPEMGAYWSRSASDQGVPERILELISTAKTEDRERFEQLLDLMASPRLGLTWLGPLRSADQLTPAQRENLLRRWAASPLPPLRNAYNSLRKLITLLFYGDVPPGQPDNPNWTALSYQPPRSHIRPDASPLLTLPLPVGKTLDCDVLVIGSGCGGGVVAAHLAAQGLDVLVVEKGGYTQAHEFTQQEYPMLQRHFEAGGLLTSNSGSISVLAGSTLGGGSTINWAGALRTPDYVLEEWATDYANPHFVQNAYRDGFDFVEKRNAVSDHFTHNPQNQCLYDAARRLGHQVGNIPMNLRFPPDMPPQAAWEATGFSCYGDAYGIKQGGVQTFLRDAVQHGARLLTGVTVERVRIESGQAVGADISSASGAHLPPIRAGRVVVCAGALHTPVLLKKSGLQHAHIGRHLYLHPVAATAGFYRQDIRGWLGPMMSVIVQEFERLHGNWGVRIEVPPLHPGLAAFALSWAGGAAFKHDMARLRHLAVHICLVRDRFGGRVEVGRKSGQPVVHYELHPFDRQHLVHGLQESVRLHSAAEAEEVLLLHNQPLRYSPGAGGLDDFVAQVAAKNWGSNQFGLFSAHQMGTCRMGGDAARCPVQPNGATREVRNLYVADASLFPSASGANPMLSIQALAYHVARHISSSSP